MTHQRWPSRGGVFFALLGILAGSVWAILGRVQAGIWNFSPCLSTAQAILAFFAAIATTAFQ